MAEEQPPRGEALVAGIIVLFGCLLILFGGGCAYLVFSSSQGWATIVQAVMLLCVAALGVALIVMVARKPK